MADKPERDEVTGEETTGHVWDDDLKELNSRCRNGGCTSSTPRSSGRSATGCCTPSWPLISGYTQGVLGYSQRETVRGEIEQRARPRATSAKQSKLPS